MILRLNHEKRILLTFIPLILGLSFNISYSQELQPEKIGDDFVQYPTQTARLYRVVDLSAEGEDWYTKMGNSRIVPEPGLPVEKEQFLAEKLRANLEKANRMNQSGDPSQKNSERSAQPTLGTQFWGNTTSGTPNDNDIAVNDGGKVISVTNTSIWMFRASSNSAIIQKSLTQFVGGAADTFDPTVTYDPATDRFVIVFLSGSHTSTSRVYVCFSATTDPFGLWNVYWLEGNIGGRWPDFTHIGLSTAELFITANMANNGSTFVVSGGLWQVNKYNGYAGDSVLTFKTYAYTETGFHPVQGGTQLYGPKFYLVQSASAPFGSTKAIRLREISNTIANGATITNSVVLNANTSYVLPPDADQKSGDPLSTNGSAITTAYYQNSRIQFALNTSLNSLPAIYYGTVIVSPIGLSFSAVTGTVIGFDSLQMAYPGLAYAGTDGTGKNQSILMFNFSSPDHYPGNACVYLDENGIASDPLMLRFGLGPMQEGGDNGVNRWGDYANAAERTNNIGEVWIGGSLGKGGSNTNGCYISQVYAPGVLPIGIENPVDVAETGPAVFPNPVVEMLRFEYPVDVTGEYSAKVIAFDGKVMADFGQKFLREGEAFVQFNSIPLVSGTYILVISNQNDVVFTEKFQIAK